MMTTAQMQQSISRMLTAFYRLWHWRRRRSILRRLEDAK
jgi:hypothetical protein